MVNSASTASIAEQQSFTRAAEKLRVAQSAISQQIKTLEEELEVQLFVRTKRSVKLTAAGYTFLREANDILNRVEQSKVEVCRAAQGETGTLSIGCVSWTTSLFLPELIRAYRIRYPGVRIDLRELTPAQQLEDLEGGSIDVGFTGRLPQPWAGRLEQERICQPCVMVALPQRHALAGSRKISLEKLAKEDWVFLDPNPGVGVRTRNGMAAMRFKQELRRFRKKTSLVGLLFKGVRMNKKKRESQITERQAYLAAEIRC